MPEGDKAAMVGWWRLRPDSSHSCQVVVSARAAVAKGDAEGAELGVQIAGADAKDQAFAREFIQAGKLFGDAQADCAVGE